MAGRPRDERGRFISRAAAEARGMAWPTGGSGSSAMSAMTMSSLSSYAAPTFYNPFAPAQSSMSIFAAARPRDDRGRFISRAAAEAQGMAWPTNNLASSPSSTPRTSQSSYAAPAVYTPPTVFTPPTPAPAQSSISTFAAARPRDESGRFISRTSAEAQGISWPTNNLTSATSSTPRASQTSYVPPVVSTPTVSTPPTPTSVQSSISTFAATRPRDESGRFISRTTAEAQGISWPANNSANAANLTPRPSQNSYIAPAVSTPTVSAQATSKQVQTSTSTFAAARPRDDKGRFISRASAEAQGIPWSSTGSVSVTSALQTASAKAPTSAPVQTPTAHPAASRPRDEKGRFISRKTAEEQGITFPSLTQTSRDEKSRFDSASTTPQVNDIYSTPPVTKTKSAAAKDRPRDAKGRFVKLTEDAVSGTEATNRRPLETKKRVVKRLVLSPAEADTNNSPSTLDSISDATNRRPKPQNSKRRVVKQTDADSQANATPVANTKTASSANTTKNSKVETSTPHPAASRPRDEKGRFISRKRAEELGIPFPLMAQTSRKEKDRIASASAEPQVKDTTSDATNRRLKPQNSKRRVVQRTDADLQADATPVANTKTASSADTNKYSKVQMSTPHPAASRPRDAKGRFISRETAQKLNIYFPSMDGVPRDEKGRFVSASAGENQRAKNGRSRSSTKKHSDAAKAAKEQIWQTPDANFPNYEDYEGENDESDNDYDSELEHTEQPYNQNPRPLQPREHNELPYDHQNEQHEENYHQSKQRDDYGHDYQYDGHNNQHEQHEENNHHIKQRDEHNHHNEQHDEHDHNEQHDEHDHNEQHDEHDHSEQHDQLCPHHLREKCPYGDHCPYLHQNEENAMVTELSEESDDQYTQDEKSSEDSASDSEIDEIYIEDRGTQTDHWIELKESEALLQQGNAICRRIMTNSTLNEAICGRDPQILIDLCALFPFQAAHSGTSLRNI